MKTYYSQKVRSVNFLKKKKKKKDWGWDQVNHSIAEVLLWGRVRNKGELQRAPMTQVIWGEVERLEGVICC